MTNPRVLVVLLLALLACATLNGNEPAYAAQDKEIPELVEIANLKSTSDYESKYLEAKEQVSKLEKDVETLREAAAKAETTFKEENRRLQQSISKLSEDKGKAESERLAESSKSTATLKSIEAVVDKLNAQVNDAHKELGRVKVEKENLEVLSKRLKMDLEEDCDKELATLTRENQALVGMNSDLLKDNEDHRSKNNLFENELQTCQSGVTQATILQSQLEEALRKIELLEEECKGSEEVVNFQSVFSSYYDQAEAFTSKTFEDIDIYVEIATSKILESYKKHLQPISKKALKHINDGMKNFDEMYKIHAAAAVDPLIASLLSSVSPVIDAHLPVFKQYCKRWSGNIMEALRKATFYLKRIRHLAIMKLEDIPRIAPYANKVVDIIFFLMAIPLVFLAFQTLVAIIMRVMSTSLFLLTCCCCCGSLGRKPTRRDVATPVFRNPKFSKSLPSKPKPTIAATRDATTAPTSKKKGKKNH
jgi:hypothetical protein